MVSAAPTTGLSPTLRLHHEMVPESWFLSSLQDESGSRSVTGGAPNGDHRLLSAILSGLIAGISTAHARTHDFALKPFS